jgi:anti-sigma B factor antagonist
MIIASATFRLAQATCRTPPSRRRTSGFITPDCPGQRLMIFHELDVPANLSRPSGQLVRFGRSKEQESMPDEVLGDGFVIGARPVSTHAVLVEILGELDIQTVAQARSFLTQATAATPRHLILDLSGVRFLASAGIALLLAAQSGQDGINGRLHLLGVSGNHPVERPLALVGLLGRFDIALDREALLASLRPVEAPHPARQHTAPAAWERLDQRNG